MGNVGVNMDNTRIEMALNAMQSKAQKMGVQGVAAVVLIRDDDPENIESYFRVVGRKFRLPEPEARGKDDLGTNYVAGAFAKAAESMRTGAPSGASGHPTLKCEFGALGSMTITKSGYRLITSFSGAPEGSQDIVIASVGINALID
jgi:hypothetical protein